VRGSKPLLLENPHSMRSWGRKFAQTLKPRDVVAFVGPLGAGKTTLIQGIAEGWGCRNAAVSPTFSLANEYQSKRGYLFHMDMYRLSDREVETFPLEDYLEQGVCLIEWADRIRDRWPSKTKIIKLEYIGERKRRLTLKEK
jgi:tRNA threonylcarbamoyladenosine biosynthesis protein TsaE